MKRFFAIFTLFVLIPFTMVLAQTLGVPVIPEVPVEPTLSGLVDLVKFLVTNWKLLGTWGISSTILVIVIAILKGPWSKDWFGSKSSLRKRLIIIVLGQILGIIHAVMGGAIWYMAIITGLIVSGGAIAIYESVKPLFSKKE